MRAVSTVVLSHPKVAAEVVMTGEFPELAERFRVRGVPFVALDDGQPLPPYPAGELVRALF